MISFESDYNNGCLPEILKNLLQSNDERTSGYGSDCHTEAAKALIRKATGLPDAEVFLLVGGTQTNATMIDALLGSGEGVICVPTAHIEVHEAGAVEAFGHKVITIGGTSSKLDAGGLRSYMESFLSDDSHSHMVQPGMVYISMPTELGDVYRRSELEELYDCCRGYGLKLYIDGARLGYGLCSPECDFDLPFLASHCHAFYIGGTKVGAMFGEAVCIVNSKYKEDFRYHIKQHGGMLAKGRFLGIQFETLFRDGLYLEISKHAIEQAMRIKEAFTEGGCEFLFDSPTNQQFPILNRMVFTELAKRYTFTTWEKLPGERTAVRFVTSWATRPEHVDALIEDVKRLLMLYGDR